ncbi:MAG: glycoside hydrolase family 32 protein [Planctomycetes bacterium]|nr:glycoside hydrolase family 32 protein [Planctomycetota bacterium]
MSVPSPCCVLVGAAALAAPAPRAERPEIVIADFEGETYGDWEVTGEAFGPGPARGTLPGQMVVSGYFGKGLVNTFFRGDGTTGTITSPIFVIERRHLTFLVGGGNHPGETCVNLIVEGSVARTQTGPNSERLRPATWDVGDLAGKTARVQIVDAHTGGWGHVNVDRIVLADERPAVVDDRDGALAKAMESVRAAAEKASRDPMRPAYHVRAPANWINDPNGPIFFKGSYHLFYQHNPFGDQWDHMHWGHVRSRDLVTWEHLPIALWPSLALGEDHCFSGCAALDGEGQPKIFYTSIGPREPECWIAVPEDDDLIKWRKHRGNPVLKESSSTVKLHEWRDPFVFRHEGKTYLVHGGNLNASKGGQAAVSLYEAEDQELVRWRFKSVLFVDASASNIECPNFFPLGGKFVLITSPHRACDWLVGRFDAAAGKFTPERRGLLDASDQLYAPNNLEEPSGRRVLWGWIRGFRGGMGWNGCMTVPRVLSLADGALVQTPAPELAVLRGEGHRAGEARLASGAPVASPLEGECLEIAAVLERRDAKAVGLRVRRSGDSSRAVAIRHDGETLEVSGTKAPLKLGAAEPLELRVFLDRSVLEVFAAGGRTCITRVIYPPPEDQGVEAFAEGGSGSLRSLEVWRVRPIW